MKHSSFFPNGRWFAGLLLMFVTYVAYSFFSPLIEDEFISVANTVGTGQYGLTVMQNTADNFWIGILVLMGGLLFYLIIAGLPGQQEERWERYI